MKSGQIWMFVEQAKLKAGSKEYGFTLVELLVVIAIILILAAALLFAINPAELLKKSRDSQRVSDLSTLVSAVNLFFADNKAITTVANTTFYSIPSTGTCPSGANAWSGTNAVANVKTCPVTPSGITGSGWMNGIDLSSISTGSPISSLPIDPTNTAASGLFYRYCNDAVSNAQYVIDAALEASANDSKEDNDGGTSGNRYELGSKLDVCGNSEIT